MATDRYPRPIGGLSHAQRMAPFPVDDDHVPRRATGHLSTLKRQCWLPGRRRNAPILSASNDSRPVGSRPPFLLLAVSFLSRRLGPTFSGYEFVPSNWTESEFDRFSWLAGTMRYRPPPSRRATTDSES